jgi:hypothetical protein
MNCAECKKELNPLSCLMAYIKDEEQHREFCGITCHEKYLLHYPRYSIAEILKNKELMEEILNESRNTKLRETEKKIESTG